MFYVELNSNIVFSGGKKGFAFWSISQMFNSVK